MRPRRNIFNWNSACRYRCKHQTQIPGLETQICELSGVKAEFSYYSPSYWIKEKIFITTHRCCGFALRPLRNHRSCRNLTKLPTDIHNIQLA